MPASASLSVANVTVLMVCAPPTKAAPVEALTHVFVFALVRCNVVQRLVRLHLGHGRGEVHGPAHLEVHAAAVLFRLDGLCDEWRTLDLLRLVVVSCMSYTH
jgi:hypothetical protein